MTHIINPKSQGLLAMCGTSIFGPHPPLKAIHAKTAISLTEQTRKDEPMCDDCMTELNTALARDSH
jgi:hypothetical protein